jgi:hypothetical protein
LSRNSVEILRTICSMPAWSFPVDDAAAPSPIARVFEDVWFVAGVL